MKASQRWLSLYLWLCSGLTFGIFGLVWYYTWKNTSGHTGVPLGQISWFFLLMAATGLITRLSLGDRPEGRQGTRLLILWGMLGAVFPSFLASLNILVGYEAWLKNGQLPVPPERNGLLLAYLMLFGLAVAVAWFKPLPPAVGTFPDQSASRSQTRP